MKIDPERQMIETDEPASREQVDSDKREQREQAERKLQDTGRLTHTVDSQDSD